MIDSAAKREHLFDKWFIDFAGNIAISRNGLALLGRIDTLAVPLFANTEQAVEWGSHLNAGQRATLLDIQRMASNAAAEDGDLQHMVDLATRSQLLREAAEAASGG